MKDLKWQTDWYKAHTLEDKKSWYDEAAIAYDRTRPRYSLKQRDRIIELTNLSPTREWNKPRKPRHFLPSNATILELGCGPGIATVDYAALGYSMVCLEPSKEACKLARKNCQNYPNVQIINTSFEEWELTTQKFDAVLAATSFHWITPEIRYLKTASILKNNGWLILLWNTPPQLEYGTYKLLEPIYQKYAPNIVYETLKNYQENLDLIATEAINSGYFNNLLSQGEIIEVTYGINDYLSLLGTLSPYIALDTQIRNFLFTDLKVVLEYNFASTLQLSYLSTWHIAQKL